MGGTAGASGASGASGIGGAGAGTAGDAGAGGTPGAGTSGTGGESGAAGAGAGGVSGAGAGGAGGVSGAGAGGAGASGAGAGGSAGQANLPSGVTAMFPGPNATSVCRDPQLRITFDGPPTLGSSGFFRVRDDGNAVVASVDMSAMTVSTTIGGQAFTLERRVYVDGNEVIVYLPQGALSYGETYSVGIEGAAITKPGGGTFTIADTTTWRFSTAAAAPASLAALSVDLRGAGQFCSVQGALDALPSGNNNASVISIAAGTYREVIYMTGKNKITLHGASRTGTVIAGTNNNNLNPSTRGRALVGIDSLSDLIVENLTIHNLTPQGGSQAEALRMQNCTHCVVRDADIKSLQDTLLWSGTVYAKNCLISGNVDFIWGNGVAYFDTCEIRTVGRSGYIVQSRNNTGAYGYVFVDSRITADAGITGSVFARIDAAEYPGSHVAYIDCEIGPHISAAGWTITGGSPTSNLRFWEYGSHAPGGGAINTSGRAAGSTQITAQQAATMRDKAAVLGGWTPPN